MPLTCQTEIQGNPDGPTLFFIHGWPDDASLWSQQVEALGPDYRCVLVTLPNFGAEAVKAGGFDFAEMVAMLDATLDEVLPEGERATLVTHDWGSYIGYLLEQAHPQRFERMIALDVGGHTEPGSAKQVVFIISYQWSLVLFWLIGGVIPPLGNFLTRQFARLLKVRESQRLKIRSRVNFPYFYLWRSLLIPGWRKNLLTRYTPACPVLYLWGKAKPVMFHSRRWLDVVAQSGGRSEGIEGAGHWLQLSHAGQVNGAIKDFLEDR